VRKFRLAVGDMSLAAHGKLLSLTKEPRFEDFTVESRNLDFDRMRRIDPGIDREMGAVAHGPVQLGAKGSAQQLTAFVDLSGASVSASGRFVKARGTPWRVDVTGRAPNGQL